MRGNAKSCQKRIKTQIATAAELMTDTTLHYNTIQYNTIQHNTTQPNTIQYNPTKYNTGWTYAPYVVGAVEIQ